MEKYLSKLKRLEKKTKKKTLDCTSEHYYHVTAMAVNFRCPSITALWTATRSAHTVKPKEAFSTLQPGNTQSLINSI